MFPNGYRTPDLGTDQPLTRSGLRLNKPSLPTSQGLLPPCIRLSPLPGSHSLSVLAVSTLQDVSQIHGPSTFAASILVKAFISSSLG